MRDLGKTVFIAPPHAATPGVIAIVCRCNALQYMRCIGYTPIGIALWFASCPERYDLAPGVRFSESPAAFSP
jgi:hypothetical protein